MEIRFDDMWRSRMERGALDFDQIALQSGPVNANRDAIRVEPRDAEGDEL